MSLDYPGGSNVIRRVLKSGGRRQKRVREMSARGLAFAGFEAEGRGPQSKECK